ncbi:MAG: TonB-dependent receptor [Polyangiaceae bacterium]|nr:TonB-dependent receptor [Polyangiaceae bacterium]
MKHAGRRVAFLLAFALGLAAPAAHADGTADEADLQFRLGKEEFKKGNYDAALAHFFASNRLAPNRNVLFNIASTYEGLQRYADAHRYYVDASTGETDERKKTDASNALRDLAPKVAVLEVVTDPPGATLYIGRKDLGSVGRAPRPLALAPGKYKVLAELEGYETAVSAEVEVIQGKTAQVSLPLTRIVGNVKVDLKGAPSATVRVDDENGPVACKAPCELVLPPGRHELHFTAEGYQSAPKLVLVEAKKSSTVTATLTPLTGTIVVRSDEREAVVKIDGKPFGFTPAVVQGIPVGKRLVSVELRGYRPFEKSVDVKSNQQVELTDVVLNPIREVTAVSRAAESIDDAPSSVTIVDGREIEAFGYPTIAESLRGVRGVALSNDRAYVSAQIRGIGQPNDYGNRVLVMSDGQSLNDNLLNSSYIGSDGRVDLHDISRIEVVRGPGSLLYGTGAFSGVINLVTRPTDGPSSVHGEIGVYDDKVIHGRAGFQYNAGPGRGVWGSVQIASSEGNDISLPITGQDPNNPASVRGVDNFVSVGTQGRAYIGPLTAQWSYHQREQVIPVGAYGTVIGSRGTQFDDRRFVTELRYEPRVAQTLQLFTRAHANHYEFKGSYDYGEEGAIEELTGSWFGGEVRAVWTPLPWMRITAGGEAQYHPTAKMSGVSVYSDNSTEQYMDEDRPFYFLAGYALLDGAPTKWFRFSAGARVDGYSTFGSVVVPRGALIFKPSDGHTIKLMGGRAFRAPSIYEQFYSDGGTTQVPAVDPARGLSLKPESVVSGELEYSVRFLEDWVVLAAGHVSHVEDIVTDVPDETDPENLFRYANSTSPVLVVGGDIELRREWRRGIMIAATYGYQQARVLDSTLKDPVLVNAPEHLASARFAFPIVRDMASFGFRGTLEAPRRIDDSTSDRTSTNLVADATVSGQIREIGVRYVVGVYNIADRRYQVPVASAFSSRTMPQNGRTFLIDAMWTWP